MLDIQYNTNTLDFINTIEDNSIDLVITSGPKYTLEELSQKDTLDYYIWQTLVNPISTLYPKVKISGAIYVVLDSYRDSSGCLLPIEPWIEIGIKRTSGWLPHSRIIWNHMGVVSKNKVGFVNLYSTVMMFIKDQKKLYMNWVSIGVPYIKVETKLKRLLSNNRYIVYSKEDIFPSIGNENIIYDYGIPCELTLERYQSVMERLIISSCPEEGTVCELYVKNDELIKIANALNRNYLGCTRSNQLLEHVKGIKFG